MRSIIGSPGRTFPPVHPLDVMADARALERACYEESLKGRPGAVSGSGGSITRGAPVIVPELGKPRQSPLTYEDHGAPFTGHLPRGSPVTTREPTPRLQEGVWGWGSGRGGSGTCRTVRSLSRVHTRASTGVTAPDPLPGLQAPPPHPTQILPPSAHPLPGRCHLLASRPPPVPSTCCPNSSHLAFLEDTHQTASSAASIFLVAPPRAASAVGPACLTGCPCALTTPGPRLAPGLCTCCSLCSKCPPPSRFCFSSVSALSQCHILREASHDPAPRPASRPRSPTCPSEPVSLWRPRWRRLRRPSPALRAGSSACFCLVHWHYHSAGQSAEAPKEFLTE